MRIDGGSDAGKPSADRFRVAHQRLADEAELLGVAPAIQFIGFYVSLAIATSLFLTGAWLVLPFTGIELTVVGVAFVIYARHAVDFERIRLYQNRLLIEQMNAEKLTQFEFNPRWVRVETGATPRESQSRSRSYCGIARSVGENRTTPCTASS